MALLSDFGGVFGVSVAIHLAYSLIRSVNERDFIEIENDLNRLKTNCDNIKNNNGLTNNDVEMSLLESDIWLVEMSLVSMYRHEPMIRTFIRVSTIIATLALGVLVLSGFYPDISLNNYMMVILLIILLFPMPIFSFITKRKMEPDILKAKKHLHSAVESFVSMTDTIKKG